MRDLSQVFNASMEEFDPNSVEVVAMTEDEADNFDDAVAKGVEVVQSANDDVATLELAASGLEAVHQEVVASLEAQTLTPQGLRFAQLAAEAHYAHVGLPATQSVSVEAMGDNLDQHVQVSLESVTTTLKRIWEAIRAAIIRAIRSLKDFFAKIFGGTKKLLANNAKLKTEVKAIGGKSPVEGALVPIHDTEHLTWKGDISPMGIVTGLKGNVKAGNTLFGVYAEHAKDFYLGAAREINVERFNRLEGKLSKDQYMENLTRSLTAAVAIEMTLGPDTRLLGDRVIKGNDGRGFTFATTNEVKQIRGVPEIAVPTVQQMTEMLDECESVIKLIDEKKGVVEKMAKAREEAVKSCEAVVKAAAEGNKLSKVVDEAIITRSIKKVHINLTDVLSVYTASSFRSVRSVHRMIIATMPHYSTGEKK